MGRKSSLSHPLVGSNSALSQLHNNNNHHQGETQFELVIDNSTNIDTKDPKTKPKSLWRKEKQSKRAKAS
jgi:hypothetical protein